MLVCTYSHPILATPWTVARQAPLSTEFSGQEYWSGLPFPPPGDLSNPGIELESLALQADSLTAKPLEKQSFHYLCLRCRLLLSSSSSFERFSTVFSEPRMSQHPAHHSSQCVLNKSLNDEWIDEKSHNHMVIQVIHWQFYQKIFPNHYGASQNIKIFSIFLVSAQPLAG